jgi:hypothetical protein
LSYGLGHLLTVLSHERVEIGATVETLAAGTDPMAGNLFGNGLESAGS